MENIQTNQTQPIQPPVIKVVILVIVAVFIVGGLIWYGINVYKKPAAGPLSPLAPAGTAISPDSTLGGQIYEQASNPIQDKLPDTVAPVPNPIQDVYKNPFQ